MEIRYGNESQWTAFMPQCGFFVDHPALHYSFVVLLPVVGILAILLNSWMVYILVSGGASNKLLQQSQHVYALGCAVTNVLWTLFGILGFWIDQFVFPCVYKGLFVCGFKNIFDQGGGFQLAFNVCLVCYDRFRLVSLGAKYDHVREVRRAKWGLTLTGLTSFLLFIVPEVVVPLTTGRLFKFADPADSTRCRMSQAQEVRWLGNYNFVDLLSILMVVAPFTFIVVFTSLTLYKLLVARRKAKVATAGTTQLADFRKLVRASLVMFAVVAAYFIAWFPYALGLCMFEINNDSIKWETIMVFIVLSDTAPLLDPFAFALTLPKLRARARETKLGRLMTYVLTFSLRNTNKVHSHSGNVWSSTMVVHAPKNLPESHPTPTTAAATS